MANKAIFLDRDDTIIHDPGYINNPDQVRLMDGVAESLIELRTMGYKLVIVSNQSGVARGIITEKKLGEIHERLTDLLAAKGAYLDRIYYCPYHPEGVIPKYRMESELRKPNPGMFLTAAQELDLDLGQSWTIGDSGRDIEAGLRAGCKTILISGKPKEKQAASNEPQADFRAVNIREAVNIIKQYYRTLSKQQVKPQAESQPQVQPEPEPEPQAEAEPLPPEPETEKEVIEEDIKPKQTAPQKNILNSNVEFLLAEILEQLRRKHRHDMFSEFSVLRLVAGVLQVVVGFCLLIAVWFLMNPGDKNNSAMTALMFAVIFQLVTLTICVMHRQE